MTKTSENILFENYRIRSKKVLKTFFKSVIDDKELRKKLLLQAKEKDIFRSLFFEITNCENTNDVITSQPIHKIPQIYTYNEFAYKLLTEKNSYNTTKDLKLALKQFKHENTRKIKELKKIAQWKNSEFYKKYPFRSDTECPQCHQKICKNNYIRHIRSNHLREDFSLNRLKCSICDMNFPSQLLLGNHERTHTGEKPFKCELCTYEGTQRANLDLHVQNNHSENSQSECVEP